MDHYFLTVICLGGPLCTIQRLTATCDAALCNFAFKFNSRHYTTGTSSSCCSATAPSWTTRTRARCCARRPSRATSSA